MESRNNFANLEKKSSIVLFSGIPGVGKSSLVEQVIPIAVTGNVQLIKISFDNIERLIANMPPEVFSLKANSIHDQISMLIKDQTLPNPLTEINLLNGITIDSSSVQLQDYDYDQAIWKESRSKTCTIVEKILQSPFSQKPFLLILDDNFLLNSMRKPYYRLAGEFQLGFCEVSVTARLETCLERNNKRKDEFRVPDQIIKNAFEKYEYSQYTNHVITFDNEKESGAKIDDLLKNIFKIVNEVPVVFVDEEEEKAKKLEAEKINKQNLIHQLDLAIRSVIGCLLGSKSEDSNYNFVQEIIKTQNVRDLRKNGALLSSFKTLYLDIVSILNDYENSFEKNKHAEDKFISETEKIILNKYVKPFKKSEKTLKMDTENMLKSYIKTSWEIWNKCVEKENNVVNLDELVHMFAKEWTLLVFHFCKFENA